MRSDRRARTKSIAVALATSIRFAGAKSSASMLLDRSTHSTIEMPSLRASILAEPSRGPAAAKTQAPRQTLRSVTGSRAIQSRSAVAAAGRTSLIRTRPHGQRCHVRAVGRRELHAVELLQRGAQLAQRGVGARPLYGRQALGRAEREVRSGD